MDRSRLGLDLDPDLLRGLLLISYRTFSPGMLERPSHGPSRRLFTIGEQVPRRVPLGLLTKRDAAFRNILVNAFFVDRVFRGCVL